MSSSFTGCHSGYRCGDHEPVTPQCGRWVVNFLVVRMDIGVVIYAGIGGSFMVIRVDKGVATYEAVTSECMRSMVYSSE